MPSLKYVLQNATDEKYRLLRGKVIECISLIGLAVGKEKFMQDCNDVMQLLLKTQTDQGELADDDPQVLFLIFIIVRLVTCIQVHAVKISEITFIIILHFIHT